MAGGALSGRTWYVILSELLLVLYEYKSSRIYSTRVPDYGQSDSPALHPRREGEEVVDCERVE